MFFQFSPVKREVKHVAQKENESEKVEILSLAPFTPNPKLFFEDVQVGKTVKRKLLIENPTNHDVNLFVTNHIPNELNVTISPEQFTVEQRSNVTLELTWQPLQEEFSRHRITIGDGRRIHRDVPVAFKSILPKKSKTGAKQKKKPLSRPKSPLKSNTPPKKSSPTKKYYSTRPPYISPKRYSQPQKKYSPSSENVRPSTNRSKTYTVHNKENIPASLFNVSCGSDVFVSPSAATFRLDYLQPIQRRETYVVNGKTDVSKSEPVFNDSLENISPDVPQEASTKRQPLGVSNRDNVSPGVTEYLQQRLASTPVNYNFEYKLMQLESFCFTPVSTPLKQNSSPKKVVTENNTFEVPRKSPNISSETYVKSNISTETYVKGNASFETYVKGNVSGGTYTKDTSVGDAANLTFSPISSKTSPNVFVDQLYTNLHGDNARSVIEANLWSGIRNKPLCSIKEESYTQQSTRESIYDSSKSFLKRKSERDFTFASPKRPNVKRSPKEWSKSGGSAVRIAKKTTGLNLTKFFKAQAEGEDVAALTKQDTHQVIIQNPFLLAAMNLADPFMTPHLHVNEEWLDQQEIDFKKWLNALLTPPAELNSEEHLVDVAKVWQECKKREVDVAPTKELVSSKYLVNNKLNALRKSAQNLFRSKEMTSVLSKVVLAVETGKLMIREDKDIHLNLALKSEVMSMLLSYNPLWLRIGLETIYNEIIPLKSNSDVVGLSTFVANRLLKDPYLVKKYKLVQSPKYTVEFKKFFLKKFLVLVYFLDQAKNKKLIPHDPCLFCKNSSIKESKEMLIKVAREMLAAVGDITKYLKYSGYVVTHVQTYIHEYDFAVNNLGVDLRDGVRLTKVMEMILMQENLTANLRVPAISRLQKVHNMKIVFGSLAKAGYEILYDISPKDIVDGHKEKTLSFLWQIVYKFQAPLMVKSATTIQTWFRSLPVVLKRRRLQKVRLRREAAATKIQAWYRRRVFIRKVELYKTLLEKYFLFIRREKAAIKIQSYYRTHRCRQLYQKQRKTVVNVQKFARGWLIRNIRRNQIKKAVIIQSYVRMFLARKRYLTLKSTVRFIQEKYRAKKQMVTARTRYTQQKSSVIVIQRWFRRIVLLKREKRSYHELKMATLCIQQRFRANRLCKIERKRYLKIKHSTVLIQSWYRSIRAMRVLRQQFLTMKKSVIIIEQRYIAYKTMTIERSRYQDLRKACTTIQRHYRAHRAMRFQRQSYTELRTATITVQRIYRANKATKIERQRYEALKTATVLIQRKFRATKAMQIAYRDYNKTRRAAVTIQVWFRATLEMRKCLTYYVSLKYAVNIFEDRYQAKKLMENKRGRYKELKLATVTLQRRYRALISMRKDKTGYTRLKMATVFIQRKFRANKMARADRMAFVKLKQAATIVQQRYRAQIKMRGCRKDYLSLRSAVVVLQRRYRANCLMKTTRTCYQSLLKYTLMVQRRFRANRAMSREREEYNKLRSSVISIQQKWRAKKMGESQQQRFEALRKATVVVQKRWRAKKLCQQQKSEYEVLKETVLKIQRLWRAKKLGNKERTNYLQLKNAAIVLQRSWRAKTAKEKYQKQYLQLKSTAILLQRRWRSTKLTEKHRREFLTLKQTVITIQQRWRANKLAQRERQNYVRLRDAVVAVQLKWRARKLAQCHRNQFVTTRNATVFIQRRWRANKLAKQQRARYEALKQATLTIQSTWRSMRLAKKERLHYLQLKSAAVVLQRRWRAKKLCEQHKHNYQSLRNASIFVQRLWRANKSAQMEKRKYEKLKTSTVIIQRYWRAKKHAERDRNNYTRLRASAVVLQQRWRAMKLCKQVRNEYEILRTTVTTVQRRWRLKKLYEHDRKRYLAIRTAVVCIQQKWRAEMLKRSEFERYTLIKRYTLKIQRRFRASALMKPQRDWYVQMRASVILIQRCYRGYLCTKKLRSEFNDKRVAAVHLQRCIRGYLVRKKYAYFFTREEREKRKMLRIETAAAVKIQAAWRGYRSRSNDTLKMIDIRQRAQTANLKAEPQNTLSSRCQVTLHALVNEKLTIATVNKALGDLDYITRHSRDVCEQVAHFLPEQMYLMIKTTNRSLPEMTSCTLCVNILINLCKYPPTRPQTFIPEHLDNIVTVMMHWCDKEVQLFPSMCTLLWLFAHRPQWRQVVASLPNIKQRLHKMQAQVTRKQSMVRRAGVKGLSPFAPFRALPDPSLEPDWGLAYEHKPYVFTNSVHAFSSLLSILNL